MGKYIRQERMLDQSKLKKATVLVAGLGGLGSPVAMYLAAAGVGNLILVDRDVFEESNLNRQILYDEIGVGKMKAEMAKKKIEAMNSDITVESSKNFTNELVKKADIIVDCFDNWESRNELWKLVFKNKKILVHGGVEERQGQIAVLTSEADGKLIPRPPKKKESPQIIGATAGVAGTRMALEVMNIIEHSRSTPKLLGFNGSIFTEYKLGKRKKFEEWTSIVVRVSEIWLKSKTTKSWMTKKFIKNISNAVPEYEVKQEGARILVSPFSENNIEKIKHVFGVKSLSPVLKVPLEEIEAEFRKVVKSTVGVSDKFRVTVHRQNKAYPMTSMKLQAELGAVVKEEIPSAIVSLKNFIHNLEIEIHRDFALIFTNRVAGPGGMPEGVEGKALALFSGGIDSPVAAWMLGKRGVSIDFLFMNPLGPILENKVNSVYASIKAWFPNSKLYVIDTSEALKQIRENIQEGERQVILKRFLYKLAEKIANRKQYDALVTGESIGQASSQTMQSITVLNEAVTLPVLRPLIGMDKEETIHLARKIGSYESSSKIAEFCSIESHSNAHPRLENILKLERGLGIDYDEVASKLKLSEKTEVESMAPSGDLHDFEIIYLLKTPKYNLKKGKKYLFVCRAAHSASEAAHKARLQGVDAFALSYKDAKKKGLKV